MLKQFLNRTNIIIITIVFFVCIFSVLYMYSGQFLFGNIIYTIQSSDHLSDITQGHDIPEFYSRLSKESGNFSIIEYPTIIQDRFNPLYQYQALHGKKILHGYFQSHALKKEWKIPEVIKNNVLLAEVIFSRLESKKLNLSGIVNLLPGVIDLYDIPSLKKSGAKYIILHKNIKDEIIALKNSPDLTNELAKGNNDKKIWQHSTRSALHLKSYYSRYLRKPVYEDDVLIVVEIN